jgi:hypothetical protein
MHEITKDHKIKALYSFWEFIDLINFKGGTKNFDPVHHKIALFLSAPQLPNGSRKEPRENYLKRLLMLHRSGLKSTLIVGYVLWRIYRNPNIRVLYNSCDKALSLSFLREITQYLIDADLQEAVWNARPHIKGVLVPIIPAEKRLGRQQYDKDMYASIIAEKTIWTQDAIQVIRDDKLKEPTIMCTSANRADTGMHYDLIINDDLVNFKNSDTKDKAQKVYIQAADMLSVLDPFRLSKVGKFEEELGREIIVTGTPYFRWDYNVYLQDNANRLGYKVFFRNIYANGRDKEDGYTCPSRFNDEYVEKLRFEIVQARGMKSWAAQYLLKCVDDESQVFSKHSIIRLNETAIRIGTSGLANVTIDGEKYDIRLMSALDPASSEASTANHSALVIGSLLPTGDLVIVGGFKRRRAPNALVTDCYNIWKQFGVYRAHVEIPPGLGINMLEIFNVMKPPGARVLIIPFKPTGDKNSRITFALDPFIGRDTPFKIYIADHLYDYLVDEVELFDPDSSDNDDDFMDALHMLATAVPKLRSKQSKRMKYNLAIDRRYGGFR